MDRRSSVRDRHTQQRMALLLMKQQHALVHPVRPFEAPATQQAMFVACHSMSQHVHSMFTACSQHVHEFTTMTATTQQGCITTIPKQLQCQTHWFETVSVRHV